MAALLVALAMAVSCLTGIVPVEVTVEAAKSYPTNDYPYENDSHIRMREPGDGYKTFLHSAKGPDGITGEDAYGFYMGECVSFATWRIRDVHGIDFTNWYGGVKWGNANNWGNAATAVGITVNSTPAIGSVGYSTSGTYGHVVWVYGIDDNNVLIEEYNNWVNSSWERDGIGCCHRYNSRSAPKSAFQYIHFEERSVKPSQPVELGTPMTSGAGQTIPDGDYHIVSYGDTNYGIAYNGYYPDNNDGAGIHLYNDMSNDVHIFTVTYLYNGFYKIVHKETGYCLDVNGASLEMSTKAQLWKENGYVSEDDGFASLPGAAQQWSINCDIDGSFTIQSRCNGYYLDICNAHEGIRNGIPLQVFKRTNANAQNWRFIPYVEPTYKPIKSGPYRIENYNSGKYLNADSSQDAAVTVGNNSNNKFFIRYTNDGCYRIESMSGNYCLDVPNSTFISGTNVKMWENNSPITSNQKWIIKDYQNWFGYYNIVSQCNGLYLDKSTSGTMVYYPDGTYTQEWRFERLSMSETARRIISPIASAFEISNAKITYGQTLADDSNDIFSYYYLEYYDYDKEQYVTVPGKFVWAGPTIKPTVVEGKEFRYRYKFIPDDMEKYGELKYEGGVSVEVLPAEAPEGMPSTEMNPAHNVKKVGDIKLSENWKWDEADAVTVLEDDTPVTATAAYTGSDGGEGNYKKESVAVTITRQNCAHPEDKQEIRGKVEPDCTNNGYTGDTYCTECDTVILMGSSVSAVGHKNTKTEASEATCESSGNIAYWTCNTCGKIFSDEKGAAEITLSDTVIPAKEHNWGAWKITRNPSETAAGSAERVCTRNSEHKDTVVVPVLTDTSVWTKTSSEEPDEENPGSRTYTSVYGEVTIEIPALGHTAHSYNGEWLYDGTTHWKKCDKCNEITVPENHSGGTADCSHKAICTVCGQEYGNLAAHTEIIDPAVDASCTVSGLSAGKHCSVCNEILVPQTVIPALGHKEDSGTVTKKPTASEPGEKTFKCINCGNVMRTEVIPVISEEHTHSYENNWKYDGTNHWHECECGEIADITAHNIVIDEAFSPSCTTPGKTEGKRCSVCGLIFTEQNEIPAAGHTIVTDPAVAASCTEAGKTEGTHCSVCGEVIAEQTIIPAAGHIGGTASCSAKAVCTICGREYGDLLSHISDGGTVTKEPSASETGTRTFRCTLCGTIISTETIPSTGSEIIQPSYPSQPSVPTVTPTDKREPYIKGNNSQTGWEAISNIILNTAEGGKVTVTMNGTTEIPKNIISEIAGKDINLVVEMDNFIWTINGKNVTNAKKVDMGIRKNTNKIPQSIISEFFGNAKTITLSLAHNGDFGFTATLTIELGTENNGFSANLFCYKPNGSSFEYGDSSEIINGKANLTFTHASEWIIGISDTPMYEDVSSASGVYESTEEIIIDRKCTKSVIITLIILAATGFVFRRGITR